MRAMRPLRLAVAATALSALALLAACGGGGDSVGSQAETAAAEASAAAAEGSSEGETAVADLKGSLGTLATAAVDVAGDAARVAGSALDTRTACQLAGQSAAFCGCLATRLGPDLDSKAIEAMASVLTEAAGGSLQGALDQATNIDPATREAVTACAVEGAVAGAVGEVTGGQ